MPDKNIMGLLEKGKFGKKMLISQDIQKPKGLKVPL